MTNDKYGPDPLDPMRKNQIVRFVALIVIVLFFPISGCINDVIDDPSIEGPEDVIPWEGVELNDLAATDGGIGNISRAINQFGVDLYLKLANGSENVFLSPYSIFAAFCMAYEGARGNTAEEMEDVLCLPSGKEERRSSFARIQMMIDNGNAEYDLSSPNRIWPQEGFPFHESFFDLIEQYYYGGIQEMDFINHSEKSRNIINEWIQNQTNDKIKDLLPQGSIDELTRMVLTNAIYFKGDWVYEFNKDETEDGEFHLSDGSMIRTPIMSMRADLNYVSGEIYDALELPYKGDDLSMIILLPRKGKDARDIESALSAEGLTEVLDKMEETDVKVHMPKFEMEADYGLVLPLGSLGMVDVFTPEIADLTGMSQKDLFISEAVHKAYIKVDEEGTEAAAATGVVIGITSIDDSVTFSADHTFLFTIVHKPTNSILFLGKVEDPTS
jgi:serpin B